MSEVMWDRVYGQRPMRPMNLHQMKSNNGSLDATKEERKKNSGASLWLGGKESACQCRRLWFSPYSGKIPLAEVEQSPVRHNH